VCSLSNTKPIFSINGRIEGLDLSQSKNVQITVSDGNSEQPLEVGQYGEFSETVTKTGRYTVRISVPFDAIFESRSFPFGYELDVSKLNDKTIGQYSIDYQPNACDFRIVSIAKVTKSSNK